MREPSEEEVKAAAIAMYMAGWAGRDDDWRDFADMARAAIKALDEYRAVKPHFDGIEPIEGCQVTTSPGSPSA